MFVMSMDIIMSIKVNRKGEAINKNNVTTDFGSRKFIVQFIHDVAAVMSSREYTTGGVSDSQRRARLIIPAGSLGGAT